MGLAASSLPQSAPAWSDAPDREHAPHPARLARLRAALIEAPYDLCTEKAELLTEFWRTHTAQHPLTRRVAPLHFAAVRRALIQNLGGGRPQSPRQARWSNRLQRLYLRLEQQRTTERAVLTFARALAYVLAHQELHIYDDELIVGNLTGHRIGAALHPDFGGLLLLPELPTLATRAVNPLRTTPEQIRTLEQDVFPYWFSRSVLARAPLLARDPALQNTLLRGREFILTQFAGISHVTPDYPVVLTKGFAGLLSEAAAARHTARTSDQMAFYDAAIMAARAAIDFGARWSAHCTAAAAREADASRAAELHELAAILDHVPAHPARTFHEALQSVFLTHAMLHQESFQHGVSFGRVDQYLYPYYAADRAAGRLTPERAIELIGCFLGKAAEQLPLFNSMATEYFSGLSSASGLTLGGVDADGYDATNELSSLFLLAYDQMRLRQPNLHLRLHPDSPVALRQLAYEVLKDGGGMPGLFNDAAIVPALERLGMPPADARDYAIVGCVEWGVPRKSFPAAGAAFLSLPAALDDVLHAYTSRTDSLAKAPFDTPPKKGGYSGRTDSDTLEHAPLRSSRVGAIVSGALSRDRQLSSGSVGVAQDAAVASMDDLLAAFRERLGAVVGAAVAGNDAIETAHARFRPTPLLSLVVDGCLASGRDVTAGGACHNSTGMQGVGLADVADSLAAIEQLVFVERRLTLDDLVAALDTDFVGHEPLRERLLTRVPKYGEDAGRAEHYAALAARMYSDLVRRHINPRGGPYIPGFWTMTTHIGFGRRLGALASGRRAGQPIADGISPTNGADRRGPTASLIAASQACGSHVGNGLALNEKLDPGFVAGAKGTHLMDALTRGYFAAGGQQVQFNILDPAVLIDAKLHPERHRDLVVRISGYSAYFNDLTDAMKDDLIARTLHGHVPACQAVPGGGGQAAR